MLSEANKLIVSGESTGGGGHGKADVVTAADKTSTNAAAAHRSLVHVGEFGSRWLRTFNLPH
jgi:hypothetical protein